MTKHQTLEQIARQKMGIETLQTRNSDNLDFHDVAVASVASALGAAYDAGRDELLAAAVALLDAKDNQMETIREWRALRRAVRRVRSNKND